MPKSSAGLLVYRVRDAQLEVFLVHPGGPFWKNKDAGAWTIPKGEMPPHEEPLATARREFAEETGITIKGPFAALGSVRQTGGKIVHVFVAPADFDASALVSNTFKLQWPPRSDQWTEFPEVDRGEWFSLDAARAKINPAQTELLTRLRTALDST
jgi:predicted NUDIX family NTP pyrophosphohydrolase